eukprot:s140_g6.t1
MPNNLPVGCAASVAGFITSITWIASYLTFAANACGQAVNNGALCAGDFTALMANFGEIATVGAAARADCNFGKNALQILTRTETISPPWKEFVPAGASPAVEKALKIKGHKDQQRNRDYDIVQCTAGITNSVSYIDMVAAPNGPAAASPRPPTAPTSKLPGEAWAREHLEVHGFKEGVTMIHPYPEVEGSKPLSDGGLYLGGSLAGAQAFVEEGTGSSLRIRFFLNRIEWNKGALEADLDGDSRSFLPVRCSVDVVLTETDAVDAKPLWAKVAELAGGAVEEAGQQKKPMQILFRKWSAVHDV